MIRRFKNDPTGSGSLTLDVQCLREEVECRSQIVHGSHGLLLQLQGVRKVLHVQEVLFILYSDLKYELGQDLLHI